MKQNESVKELEVGKDYINVNDSNIIVIDRKGRHGNKGFEGEVCRNSLSCLIYKNWREATKEEVIEAFKKHLVHRYGEDWETMKIKETHPSSTIFINNKLYKVEITKNYDGWNVWNENGLLYCEGVWVERLEEVEEPKIHIKEAIKEKTVVHCETEEEAERILNMAIELGYTWNNGRSYKGDYKWVINESATFYNILKGLYGSVFYTNNTIIPSTQIADLEPEKSTDLSPSPEDVEAMNKKEIKMKKYRLKQWYPSLCDDLEVGTGVEYDDGWIYYINKRGNKTAIEIDERELIYKDFWELVEEDGWLVNPFNIELPIDRVTVTNLGMALRMVDIQLSNSIIDKVIDLVELIENKGDNTTIEDIVSLQQTW